MNSKGVNMYGKRLIKVLEYTKVPIQSLPRKQRAKSTNEFRTFHGFKFQGMIPRWIRGWLTWLRNRQVNLRIVILIVHTCRHMAVCQNLVPLVNIKIAGKWMFIPLKMVLVGIDPYPYKYNIMKNLWRSWMDGWRIRKQFLSLNLYFRELPSHVWHWRLDWYRKVQLSGFITTLQLIMSFCFQLHRIRLQCFFNL